jgi:hypothetical protein
MEELDEAAAPVSRREKCVDGDGIVMDGVEDEAACFPEEVAVEQDVGHGPGEAAVRAFGVIPGGWTKGGRIVGVEGVMGGELKRRTLECA